MLQVMAAETITAVAAAGGGGGGGGGGRLQTGTLVGWGNGKGRPLQVLPANRKNTGLLRIFSEKEPINPAVRPGNTGGVEGDISGRYALDDYVGVWSVFDDGEVPPRLTIGGPGQLLKDARGIAVDPKSKDVMVSDKTWNAVFRFHVPEAF